MNFNAADFLEGLKIILAYKWFPYVCLIAFVIGGYFAVQWIESKEVNI